MAKSPSSEGSPGIIIIGKLLIANTVDSHSTGLHGMSEFTTRMHIMYKESSCMYA